MERAVRQGEAGVSAITFWEVAMLRQKGRMTLLSDASSWRATLLEQGLIEIPVDGEIGIRANGLADFHADPADRIIVATALAGHRLLTSDARILSWSGNLDRLDARE
jgi:PIN domain nuclease of toxin-antitoxin system